MTDVHGCRIVAIDDQPANLVALAELLRVDGFGAVHTTTRPAEVLAAIDAGAVDLLICDIQMPEINGLALIEQVRARLQPRQYLPILMVTAHASPDVVRHALSAGAQDLVRKPFDAAELLLRVRNLLETRSLHLELEEQRRWLQAEVHRHEQEAARLAEERAGKAANVERALAPGALRLVFQPIVDVRDRALLGMEALTRFTVTPERTPDVWFSEAQEVGRAVDLELAVVSAAIPRVADLGPGAFLALNLSPEVAMAPGLVDVLEGVDCSRLVVELTEHSRVPDYERLHAALEPLRATGLRFAVDDAGAGYSSFQHILRLRPDIIKLDLDLTRGIDVDPIRRALAAALVPFGREIGALLVAEGVESAGELDVLRDLGFDGAQGYYLGRPAPFEVSNQGEVAGG
jgi:EAL domain-containing protein (putative c-di-GMP-specific phosphodiesterase class I)/DNA-binding response OmpR family regulator